MNVSDVRLSCSVICLARAPNVSSTIASLLLRILAVHRLLLPCSFFLLQCTDKNWATLTRDSALVELSTLAFTGISPSGIYTALHSCTSFVFFHWRFRPLWPVYVNFTLLAIFSSSLSLNEDKEEVRELLACYAGISDASAPNSDTKSWMILVYQYNSVEHNYVLFK